MKLAASLITLFITFTIATSIHAAPKQTWSDYVKQMRIQALEQGIRPEVFDEAFAGIKAPNRKVLHLDRTQPEKRLTFLSYRNTRADAYRIKIGQKELKKHNQLLTKISDQYGVSKCFIVSLWGLETSYGRFMGGFPVIKSLATLGYDNRRSTFFRKQLMHALHILNDEHIKLKDFKGEWAGATGQPQFLPSSWRNYAVDHDGDGRKDIWKTMPDVFASIANYLKEHGWKTGQPWAFAVKTPAGFDESLMGSKVIKTVAEWKAMGVIPVSHAWPDDIELEASIIRPYGGPDMMIFNNFRVIMKWNRSNYYAGTVGYMAEKVCKTKL